MSSVDIPGLGMAMPTLDLGSFSTAQLQSMLSAAQAEVLVRMTGRVAHGSSAAQSYGMDLMTYPDLVRLVNALGAQLGFDFGENRATPNFAHVPPPPEQTTFGVGP
jgi:hypothetical protein